jgi:putative membrane protein
VPAPWTFEPLQLATIALAALLYWRRTRTLAARGAPVPAWRQASFATGLALVFLALASPVHALGEERLFSAHMLQHVVLGDLAALAVVAGLTGPLLRPVLAVRAVERLRVLAHPLVALEHVLFFGLGALMWAPVVEVLPAPAWFGTGAKLGYIVVVRFLETILGNVFFWAGTPFYATYAAADRPWGLSALADQGIAGGIMMTVGGLVTIGALAWLFLRLAQEGELRQQLLERGMDPRAVQRAVRYGRAEELGRSR